MKFQPFLKKNIDLKKPIAQTEKPPNRLQKRQSTPIQETAKPQKAEPPRLQTLTST